LNKIKSQVEQQIDQLTESNDPFWLKCLESVEHPGGTEVERWWESIPGRLKIGDAVSSWRWYVEVGYEEDWSRLVLDRMPPGELELFWRIGSNLGTRAGWKTETKLKLGMVISHMQMLKACLTQEALSFKY